MDLESWGVLQLVATGAVSDFALIQSNNPIAVFQFSRSFATDNNLISESIYVVSTTL